MERCDVPSDCHIDNDNENLMQFAFLACTFHKNCNGGHFLLFARSLGLNDVNGRDEGMRRGQFHQS